MTKSTTKSAETEPQLDGDKQGDEKLQADGNDPAQEGLQTTGEPVKGDGVLDKPVGGERFANAGVGDDVVHVNALEEGDVSGAYKAYTGGEELVEVTQDVMETFYFPDTKRPAQRLRFTKGQIVRKSEIDALAQAAPAQS
jgi:hypothetical protein